MDMVPKQMLSTGEVGYIMSGIKNAKEVQGGDTITHTERSCSSAISGFQ
jgi:GTP-binding protein LepA